MAWLLHKRSILLVDTLGGRHKSVLCNCYPVAGRMPGHMNAVAPAMPAAMPGASAGEEEHKLIVEKQM